MSKDTYQSYTKEEGEEGTTGLGFPGPGTAHCSLHLKEQSWGNGGVIGVGGSGFREPY